jgi:hypothetical protein
MIPRSRPQPRPAKLIQLSPERAAELRVAVEESCRDEGRALTPDELRRLAETGEWPDS